MRERFSSSWLTRTPGSIAFCRRDKGTLLCTTAGTSNRHLMNEFHLFFRSWSQHLRHNIQETHAAIQFIESDPYLLVLDNHGVKILQGR